MRTIPNMSSGRLFPLLVVGLLVTVTGCSAGTAEDDGRPMVLTSTTILADVVRHVVGDAAEVESVMPPGADPHDFSLSSADAGRIGRADLVVVGGLGLDTAIQNTAEAAGRGRLLVLAPLLDPLPFRGAEAGQAEGMLDPHFWQDPVRMAHAVDLIAGAVVEAIPGVDGEALATRATEYAAELRQLDSELSAEFSAIPAERRVIVTNHDALGYFADRYGLDVASVVLEGGDLAEPSSAALRKVVDTISGLGVKAIFVDNVEPADLARAVAAEVGPDVQVIELATDSLGTSGAGSTGYEQMIRSNAEAILSTMR